MQMQQNNEVILEAGGKIQKVKNNGIGNGKKKKAECTGA
jgi:hypothetical protein